MAKSGPAAKKARSGDGERRHILITQCLQNDFFLNGECRLVLRDQEIKRLLVSQRDHGKVALSGGRRRVDERYLARGPLGLFLGATIGAALEGKTEQPLYVVNIRDWHNKDDLYDRERRVVGRHCERQTWGASYIEGLERYLDPEKPLGDGRARFCNRRNARIYQVHADSLFDFRPRWGERHANWISTQGRVPPRFKHGRSELQALLDVLIAGTATQVEELNSGLGSAGKNEEYQQILQGSADKVGEEDPKQGAARVYVVVIGVYTDVKVQVLLTSLRNRYDLPNLGVSDTLTRSQTLERHLGGLDFADKVLGVEIVHGINDSICYLGCETPKIDEADVIGAEDFTQYRSYFMDKQTVLAHGDDKVQQYTDLTGTRSIRLYETIRRANTFLIWSGAAFLVLALAGSILHFIDPVRWSWEYPVATGGLGVAELVTVFFAAAIRGLQRNLTNLVSLKMILERHSLKDALTRYHLTTPEVLREVRDQQGQTRATAQIETLARQLRAIDESSRSDYEALVQVVAFTADGAVPPVASSTDSSTAERSDETVEPSAAAVAEARTPGGSKEHEHPPATGLSHAAASGNAESRKTKVTRSLKRVLKRAE